MDVATNDRSVPAVVDRFVVREHADTVAAVLTAADAVSKGWNGGSTSERASIVGPLRRALDQEGLTIEFPPMLRGAAGAAGLTLQAEPVAAPPYVVITSTGPVLRATAHTGRLVVSIRAFTVDRGDRNRYRRTTNRVESAVSVAFRTD